MAWYPESTIFCLGILDKSFNFIYKCKLIGNTYTVELWWTLNKIMYTYVVGTEELCVICGFFPPTRPSPPPSNTFLKSGLSCRIAASSFDSDVLAFQNIFLRSSLQFAKCFSLHYLIWVSETWGHTGIVITLLEMEIKAQRLGNQRDSRQQLGREVALPWRADSVYSLLPLQFGKLECSPSFTDEEIGKHTFLEVLWRFLHVTRSAKAKIYSGIFPDQTRPAGPGLSSWKCGVTGTRPGTWKKGEVQSL